MLKMVENIIEFSKENPKLAIMELKELTKDFVIYNNLALTKYPISTQNLNKSGYLRKTYQVIYKNTCEKFVSEFQEFEKIPQRFYLKEMTKEVPKELKISLGRLCENNGKLVDFRGEQINLFLINEQVYLAKQIWKADIDYINYRNSIVLVNSATLLDVKIARSMLLLSRINENDIILDPFCGAGGILIEGCRLYKNQFYGSDLFHIMLRKARLNLIWFRCKNATVLWENALNCQKLVKKFGITKIITDFPYGFRSKIRENLPQLIESVLSCRLRTAMLIIDKKEIDETIREICKKYHLKIENSINIPVNRNFSRKLYVIDKESEF